MFFIPTSTVLRRELWDARRTTRWPDWPIGDVVFWYDAAVDGTPMYWVDEALADYRRHEAQISGRLAIRTAIIEINRGYAFPDRPEVDIPRRERMTRGYIGRGGERLRTGDPRGAREDFAHARREAPQIWTRKRQAMTAATYLPGFSKLMAARTARAAARAAS
ncbi:MAG: hypothetical protein AAGC46_02020 [Solirubrobacteraceae bacterium]|nr:hypothetical protein [Patulibacter sp.]